MNGRGGAKREQAAIGVGAGNIAERAARRNAGAIEREGFGTDGDAALQLEGRAVRNADATGAGAEAGGAGDAHGARVDCRRAGVGVRTRKRERAGAGFVSVPLVVPITPATAMSPGPSNVRPKVAPPMAPVSVSVPASLWILVAPVSVRAPVQVLAPERLRSAPSVERPVPLRVSASPVTVRPPCKRSAAPAATVVPAALVPSAVVLASVRAPALTVVGPS